MNTRRRVWALPCRNLREMSGENAADYGTVERRYRTRRRPSLLETVILRARPANGEDIGEPSVLNRGRRQRWR